VAYVGRFSHRLLVQEDLAMPLNLVDPATGITYFQAARRFAELGAANKTVADLQKDPSLIGPTAAYWQNMIAPLVPGDSYSLACSGGSTLSPVLAAYDLFNCNLFNETTPLWQLDQVGSDFSGIPGIAGANGTNYYPTKLGGSAAQLHNHPAGNKAARPNRAAFLSGQSSTDP